MLDTRTLMSYHITSFRLAIASNKIDDALRQCVLAWLLQRRTRDLIAQDFFSENAIVHELCVSLTQLLGSLELFWFECHLEFQDDTPNVASPQLHTNSSDSSQLASQDRVPLN